MYYVYKDNKKRKTPENRWLSSVQVTGLEPACLSAPEPNGNETLLEQFFFQSVIVYTFIISAYYDNDFSISDNNSLHI